MILCLLFKITMKLGLVSEELQRVESDLNQPGSSGLEAVIDTLSESDLKKNMEKSRKISKNPKTCLES